MYQTGKNSWFKHWDFILLDSLCLQIAYIGAFMLRHGGIMPYSWQEYRNMGIIMALTELCVGFFSENYKNDYLNCRGEDEAENLYLRFLMVTDFISGMTDSYAKNLYRELNGID